MSGKRYRNTRDSKEDEGDFEKVLKIKAGRRNRTTIPSDPEFTKLLTQRQTGDARHRGQKIAGTREIHRVGARATRCCKAADVSV